MTASEAAHTLEGPRSRWTEPTAAIRLKWGGYNLRLILGVAVLALGYAIYVALYFPLDLNDHMGRMLPLAITFVTGLLSAAILPGTGTNRVIYGSLVVASSVVFIVPATMLNANSVITSLLYSLAAALLTWGWLVLRERRKALWLLAPATFLFSFLVSTVVISVLGFSSFYNVGWPELFGRGSLAADPSYVALLAESAATWVMQLVFASVAVVGAAWAARALQTRMRHYTPAEVAARAAARAEQALKYQAEQTQAAESRMAEARVEEIKKWEAAYAQAHDGQTPPPGYMPAIVVNSQTGVGSMGAPRTNTLAILALIFGLLGGWLGILFGFIALSQIKRTSEGGRGIAIVGIVAAFLWVIASVVIVAIAVATANR